jgi:VWFA-related protein
MMFMPVFRAMAAGFVCLALFTLYVPAQQPPVTPAPQQASAEQPERSFTVTLQEVVAPVMVFDRSGDLVNGLQPNQFRLFDNGKEQDIHVDVSFEPISLVIAIQANADVEAILPQVKRIGTLIRPIVIGDQGEAAVLAFDHRVRLLQEFTNDSDKVDAVIKKITPGSYTSAMIDGVHESVRLLSKRPKNRRRILLLISETRDKGSEGRKRETLIAAQLSNVEVYAVDMSRFVATLSAKPNPPRPDPMPTTQRQGTLPMNVPATPTSVAQTFGQNGGRAEFLPLLKEVLKDVKDIFVDNPVELFTKGTGGQEFSFYRQRGLEDAIATIGAELHSQYLITYNPNNKEEAGFHEIEVTVSGVRGAKVRTRPGYWMAAKYQ